MLRAQMGSLGQQVRAFAGTGKARASLGAYGSVPKFIGTCRPLPGRKAEGAVVGAGVSL